METNHTASQTPTHCRRLAIGLACWALCVANTQAMAAEQIGTAEVFSVAEIAFRGPRLGPADTPARDIDLAVVFRHEDGSTAITVQGFCDGDGRGGSTGDVFMVRFCPTRPGRWTLVEVRSNRGELAGQHQGDWLVAEASPRHGFWEVDARARGRRWYAARTDRTSTSSATRMYSFLSGYGPSKSPRATTSRPTCAATPSFSRSCVSASAADRYPNPGREAVPRRRRPADRRRQLLAPPQSAVVPPAGRSGRADRAGGRPDRRSDPLRAGYGRLRGRRCGPAATAATPRRGCVTSPPATAAIPTSGSVCATSSTSGRRSTRRSRSPPSGKRSSDSSPTHAAERARECRPPCGRSSSTNCPTGTTTRSSRTRSARSRPRPT